MHNSNAVKATVGGKQEFSILSFYMNDKNSHFVTKLEKNGVLQVEVITGRKITNFEVDVKSQIEKIYSKL